VKITAATLRRQHDSLSKAAKVALHVAARPCPHVDVALLEALASRETNMKNIIGDGGHGRGMFQADDRWQEHYLRMTPGCRSGSSIPMFPTAWPKGRVPTISSGARFAARTIEANVAEAKRRGVKDGHRLHVAVDGYNCGITGAINAYQHGGLKAADEETTGGDYAPDVLERAATLRRI
jgi:hypothetical protein